MGVRVLAVAALCTGATLMPISDARSAIPQGNTLLNSGGETGTAVSDEISHICPQGWTCNPASPNTTLVQYGTTIFPSAAESARIGGGNNFFAGGPDNPSSSATQTVDLGIQPEFAAGQVKATFSGCLGGQLDQLDFASIQIAFLTPDNPDIGIPFVKAGPTAAERGNNTTLLPVSSTVAVPPTTQGFRFTLSFSRESAGTYNNGYADNLSVTFGPAAGPDPPAASCSTPPGSGGGGGGGTGGGPGGGTGEGGELKLLSFGSATVGRNGTARVRVRCNTAQVSRCKGTVSASLARASKSAKRRLGTASYSVGSLKTRTIKIRLRRSDARRIRRASSRSLARLRLKLRATTKVSVVKFRQTELLRIKRRG